VVDPALGSSQLGMGDGAWGLGPGCLDGSLLMPGHPKLEFVVGGSLVRAARAFAATVQVGVPRWVVLPICSIVEPAADDQTHKLRLQMEAQSGVKVLSVVCLESDVLAGHGAYEVSDHCCRNATPADG
jgi:hypothetical protein